MRSVIIDTVKQLLLGQSNQGSEFWNFHGDVSSLGILGYDTV